MTPCLATLKRRMLTVTLALFLAQQWLGSAEAVAAGIVPAANAPAANHPLTDTARNGVPIVDIAPPSAAGVSNNQYSQFNTASHGAILNNSAGNVQTQLGGWISGNPLLGPTPAKVILNQVTSGTPSQLLGALEVAGQAADVVVANPAGIACNGCSFINTPHATLTTGTPEFDAAGNLRGFNVTQGVIDVGAGGLDAQQAERLDLDARGLTAEGGIWAHQLGVVAGAADVPYGSTQASAQAGAGNAPEFAVDVSALGGMYADTIDLVATDAGLGVNSQGRLAALQGNLRLAADGKLSLADTSATGAVQLSGANVSLSGITASTGGSVQVNATGTLDNSGQVDSASGLSLQAASVTNTGTLVQRDAAQALSLGTSGSLANTGTIASAGGLSAQAGSIADTGGVWGAQGDLSLRSLSQSLTDTTLQAGGTITLAATEGDLRTMGAQITGNGKLSASASGLLANAGGTWQSAGNAALQGASITNSGTVQAGGTLQATAANTLNNAGGTLESTGDLGASGASLTNDGGALASGAATTLTARQGLSNQGGTISAASSLSVDAAAAALNNASGTLVSGGAATISAGALSNTAGTVAAVNDLGITSAALDNTGGRVQTTGNLVLGTQGQALSNAGGKIEAAGSASLSTGALDNTGGTLSAHALSLTLGALTNDGGSLVAATTLQVTTGALGNAAGLIESGGNLSLDTQGATLSNTASGTTGGILSGGALSLRSGALNNTTGVIASQGDQSLDVAGDLDNAGGSIATQGGLAVTTAGTLTNTGGTLAALGTANLNAGTLDNSGGGQISAQDLTLTAGSIGNRAGTLQAGQDASVSTSSLDNTSGTLSAQRQLAATATSLANSGGTLVGNAGLSLTTSSSSFGGTINSAGAVNLTVNGAYVNTGTLSTQGDLNVQAQSLSNAAGATLASGGNLSATTSGDLSNAGTLDAAGSATLAAGGTLSNSGLIDSGAATTLTAQALDNTGRIYGGTVGITAASLSNSGGAVIASRADMTIAADSVSNTGDSTLLALGALSIAGAFDPGTGAATRTTASLLNASSTIQAGGNLALDAASVTNRNDHLVLGTSTSTQALTDTVVKVQGTSPATALLDASTLGYVPHGNPVDGGRAYWVLPSTQYPFAVFGAAPINQEISTCTGGDPLSCTPTYTYTVSSPVWQKFGVSLPGVPTPPAGVTQTVDAYGNVTIGSSCYDNQGNPITTGACGGYFQTISTYASALSTAEGQLDNAITAFNNDQRSRVISQYVEYHVDSQTTVTPSVVSTDPARILAGGNLTVTGGGAGSLLNADSAIVAGGSLDIATGELNNQATTATQTQTQTGAIEAWTKQSGGQFSSDHLVCNGVNYPPCGAGALYTTQSSNTVDLNTVTVVSGGNPGTGSAPAAAPVTPSSMVAPGVAAPRPVAIHAPPALQQVSVPGMNGGSALVVSTSPPSLDLPANQLFQVDAAPNAPYVVETDPAFTNQENFLSSDYYLQQLNINPAQWQLRYGDGFAEQQLVQNQILALTGRDILADYTSTQAEYQALMNAGLAYAKAYGIAPGVSLSAAQMARITTDMVLLSTQTVTLPDGSTRQVLVPQVYLAHPQGQDLTQGGALIAGGTVTLTTAQDLVNSGTVGGSSVSASAGQDLVNRGTIAGQNILLSASNDLQDLSGLVQGTSDTSSLSLLAGRDLLLQTQAIPVAGVASTNTGTTSLGHVATVQGGSITLQAARDLVAQGAQVASAGDLTALAGRNLNVGAATTTYQFATSSQAGDTLAIQQSGSIQHGSTLSAGGNATLVAQGGDLTVQASQVAAGHDAVLSGHDVTIAAGVNSASDATQLQWSAGHATLADSSQSAAGAGVSAGNNLTVQAVGNGQAGSGDLTVTGATLSAQNGQATLQAAHDLSVGTLALSQSSSAQVHSESHGFVSHGSVTSDTSSASTTQQGSTVSGNTVAMDAGHDLGVSGSNVAGTGNVALQAGHDVTITAATNTASSSSYYEADHSGLFSSGMGFTLGHSRQTDQTNGSGTTQSSSRSLVGSTSGNLSITAGNAATVSGSDLVAGISNGQAAAGAGSGNLSIDAKTITIDPGADQQQSTEHQTFSQSGLSVSLGGAVVNAQQSIDQVAQAAQSTTDARVKALAGATAGLAAYNATQAVGNDAVSLSVTAGSSHSDSTSASSSLTHNGSTLSAAGNVDLNAHGGAQASNLTITGSQVKAGGNVKLSADNAVTLQAAQDTTSSQSASHSSSSAVGLGVSAGSSGWAAGVTASASRSRSQGHGSSLSQQNTTVSAGQSLAIHSGGDTTLAGAVASGRQVTADVGGNLNITSLQDTASSHSSGQSVGASVTAGVGFSGSASASSQHLDASYASVQQQSGLEAGDGGFQVKVQGHTGLTGGVIESSQAAVEQGRNRLITGTLTTASVANSGSYSGQSLGVSAGLSAGPGQSGQASTNGGAPQPTAGPSHEASFGNSANVGLPTAIDASGSASSTTPSGISGGTITITNAQAQQQLTGQTTQQAVAGTNRNVSTGTNTANAIANPYNASQVQAAFTVTQAFTQQVGQYLAIKAAQADAAQKALDNAKADPSATPQQVAQAQQQADASALWAPGGAYNRILTAFTAAAGGNATGGATQLVQAAAVGYLQGLGAQQVKALADGLESQGQPNATSEAVRTALQALVGCAGAQAATGSCSAGAMGAAASVVLNDALDAAQGVSGESLSPSDKQNRQNLVGSLVAGIAAQAGINANAASGSAQVETGNNALSLTQMAQAIQKTAGCLNTMDMGCVRQTVDAARKLDQAQSDAVDQGALAALQQRWQGVKNIPASLSNLASLIQSDPGQAAALLGQAIAQLPANLVHQYSGELQAIMTAYLSGTSPQQFQQAGAAMANLAVDVATVVASDGVAEVAGAGTSATLDAVNSGLAKMGISDALPVATNSAATGTVWDSITATQPNYPGSVIPQSFEMSLPNGQSVWVHGNATEHMAEYAQMVANNNPPGVVQLTTQQQLSSLQSAVNTATQGGVPYNQLINVGGWELKFAPPRQPGQLPALIHALPTGK